LKLLTNSIDSEDDEMDQTTTVPTQPMTDAEAQTLRSSLLDVAVILTMMVPTPLGTVSSTY